MLSRHTLPCLLCRYDIDAAIAAATPPIDSHADTYAMLR